MPPDSFTMHLVLYVHEDRHSVLLQEPPRAREREAIDGTNEPGCDIAFPPGPGLWVWIGEQYTSAETSEWIKYMPGTWRRPSVDELGVIFEGLPWPHAERLTAEAA